MTNENSTEQDRRRRRRYPAVKLTGSIKTRKGILSEKETPVLIKDFSSIGMAFVTEKEIPSEKPVTVSLILEMEMGRLTADKIIATVKNSSQSGSLFRYGLEFDFGANRHMKSNELKTQLERIEKMLERSDALRERIDREARTA